MKSLSQELKRKRDAEARARASDPAKNIIYTGDGSSGAGGTGYTPNPSILLDETAHDALDHTGLTGVPSIAGLLDEAAHDALDHTGLAGVATDFVDLGDVPSAYTGAGGKIVAVKSDVSGLEFVAAPAAENGVPVGGTTNQLAAKNSNADYDIKWMDAPAAANGLPSGGTAGQILTKDTATDYDASWQDPSGGGGGAGGSLFLYNYAWGGF
jgi:hypothetical protein